MQQPSAEVAAATELFIVPSCPPVGKTPALRVSRFSIFEDVYHLSPIPHGTPRFTRYRRCSYTTHLSVTTRKKQTKFAAGKQYRTLSVLTHFGTRKRHWQPTRSHACSAATLFCRVLSGYSQGTSSQDDFIATVQLHYPLASSWHIRTNLQSHALNLLF